MSFWRRNGGGAGGHEAAIDGVRLAIGRQESRRVRSATYPNVREAEFQVFSQWGEDGIIQYLLGKVTIPNQTFVEFGAGDYAESNTRFLLCNDDWRGLVIDGGKEHLRFISRTGLDWRHDLQAVSAFIDAENIDGLIRGAGLEGDLGLLSVDLDGNDYWVLDAIRCVQPRILVVEYNSIFGPDLRVTVPYRRDFQRTAAHYSNLYYGASAAALCELAGRKGFVCVGGNSAGNNLFFVRGDLASSLPRATPAEAWVESRFRESRGKDGALTLIGPHPERLRQIASLPLLDLATGRERLVRDLFKLP